MLMRAAVLQMVSSDDVAENLCTAAGLIADAVSEGAQLLVLPENFGFMGRREADKLAVAETAGSGPQQDFLAEQAAKNGIWLVGGTLPIKADKDHVYAASFVHGPQGQVAARYDKIHLFDVSLPAGDQQKAEGYKESASIMAGASPVCIDAAGIRMGLTVCYDLRFPEIYRHYSAQGAALFTVPSAFTAKTGVVHWAPLLRARAIENQCFVLAANQGGRHVSGRDTWGHSMIIDPWGEILASCETGAQMVCADLDLQAQADLRRDFPALQHIRLKPGNRYE